jgi:UDP-N-acetylglucosamine acyltransferase
MAIHPTTVINGDVKIDDDVEIGPYCLIQGRVHIKRGTIVESHVTMGSRYGVLEIGENNHFAPGAVIGGPPQDVSFKAEETRLKIGNNNVFREFTTANMATSKGDKETTIGDHNYFMSYTHVGHDCKVGNNVVIANNTHLGGHTTIEDGVTIGGVCAFNQFTRVGKGAFVAGSSVVIKDILPFCRARGDYAFARATNKIGLARKGFSREEVQNIHKALRILILGAETVEESLARIKSECTMSPNLEHLINFIKTSKRGLALDRRLGSVNDEE